VVASHHTSPFEVREVNGVNRAFDCKESGEDYLVVPVRSGARRLRGRERFTTNGDALGNYPLTLGNKNPYVDTHLGREVRWFLTLRSDIDMRLPDEILKCVVFIGKKRDEEIQYCGTGFLVQMQTSRSDRSLPL